MDDLARDRIYAGQCTPVADFAFDESVVRVFPDMILRSVPCYQDLVRLIGLLGGRFLPPGGLCFDLGCSLGAVSASLLAQHPERDFRIRAVDNAPAMIDKLRDRLAGEVAAGRLEPECADLAGVDTSGANLIILNLTLQFTPPDQRLGLLRRFADSLLPGGGLVLAEKVQFQQPEAELLLSDTHAEFKRANGYSELEISRKRAALERVMRLDSPRMHQDRLRAAGFKQVVQWFQCLNFVAWAAWI